MPWSNFRLSQKSSADEKVKVGGPPNQHCHSSFTTQPHTWIWTKNENAASSCFHLRPPASNYVRFRPPMSTCIHLCQPASSCVHLCPPQWVTVPSKMLNDTDTFSGTKYFRYRYRYFFPYQILPIPIPRLFPVPNYSDTGSETSSKNEKILVLVPIPLKIF